MLYVFMPDTDTPPSLDLVGGKALGLYHLREAGCDVPPWFALTSAAWAAVHTHHPAPADEAGSDLGAPGPSPDAREEMQWALRRLALDDALLAVRSSARVEDGRAHSFAGQFASVLHVRPGDLAPAVARVWASARSRYCRAYARQNGVPLADLVPAVVVQRMLDPDISGVLFTADPVRGDREVAVVAALYGLGEGVVSGSCSADTYRVDRAGDVVHTVIAHKTHCVRFDAERGEARLVDVPPGLRDTQVCSEDDIRRLTALGRHLADTLGAEQDLEWCRAHDRMYILQTRPITTLPHPDAGGDEDWVRVWDNANLVESYPEVTLPLTFSFIDAMYAGVYRRLSRAFGLGVAALEQETAGFRMLGYHHGRAYYNLLNWYRILSGLPGGAKHCRNFDDMLGTGGGSGTHGPSSPRPAGRMRSVWVGGHLAGRFLLHPVHVRRFLALLRRVRERSDAVDLDTLRLPDLVEHYETFQCLLLRHWITPQFNDFYCQTVTGWLWSALSRWLGEAQAEHLHEMLTLDAMVESERAVASLGELAAWTRERPDLIDRCQGGAPSDLLQALRLDPVLATRLDDHLERFGDRWHGELKLETVTPREDPEVLMDVLASHVRTPPHASTRTGDAAIRQAIAGLPAPKRWAIGWLARLARSLIANRENTRFERTRVFGMVRRVFRTIGRTLAARGHLDEADDIFYLTKEEIFAFIAGTSVDPEPATTARRRRAAFAAWQSQYAPGRFLSRGLLADVHAPSASACTTQTGLALSGVAASPGIVRARVRIIRSPTELGNARGCIVAAESTDPGWSFIFPLVAGILVERGSMLSHAAIVAREMNIPAVVAVEGLLQRIPNDSLVELDGTTGTVTLLEERTTP